MKSSVRLLHVTAATTLLAVTTACESPKSPLQNNTLAQNLSLVARAPVQGTAGQPGGARLTFQVAGPDGAPLPGASVRFAAGGGGAITPDSTVSDAQGRVQTVWTLGVSDSQYVEASVPRTGGGVRIRIGALDEGDDGTAATITLVSGDGQTGWQGRQLYKPLVFLVTNREGHPLPAQKVVFVVESGGGSMFPDSVLTDFEGEAIGLWTVGAPGPQSMEARVPRDHDTTLTARATATAASGMSPGTIPLGQRPFGLAVSSAGTVYVTRLDAATVSVVDPGSLSVTGDIAAGQTPTAVAFDPSGTTAYVANQYSDNIGIVDVASARQVAVVPVTGDAFNVVVAPDNSFIFATTNASWLFKISPTSRTVVDSMKMLDIPNGFAFSHDGTKLYVSDVYGGAVEEVDLGSWTVSRTFTTAGGPQGIVVSPDGAQLAVSCESGVIQFWNLASGTLTASAPLSGPGFGLAQSPDGALLYAGIPQQGVVLVFDAATHQQTRVMHAGGIPRRLGFAADGKTLMVANEAGWVNAMQ